MDPIMVKIVPEHPSSGPLGMTQARPAMQTALATGSQDGEWFCVWSVSPGYMDGDWFALSDLCAMDGRALRETRTGRLVPVSSGAP